ncbi:PD-(D/E)XK nuclease family protein [Paenibacillus sp. TRM 82003]|nr:PD-(D/E)XK nuclease family protein [Paenibacillus sp. TRM 82003]
MLNVEIETPEGLALRMTEAARYARGLTYARPEETYWLVYSIMRSIAREEPDAYVAAAMVTSGVVDAFHKALLELRDAGMTPERIDLEAFETPDKGRYVRRLLEAYSTRLREDGLTDFAGLCELAAEVAASLPDGIVIADDSIRLSKSLSALLRLAGGGDFRTLPADPPMTIPASGFPHERLEWFRALGPLAEAKEAVRRIAADGAAWDQTEVVLSDYAGCVPVWHAWTRKLDIPCTFAGGLTVRVAPLGRAALTYLDWLSSDFRAAELVPLLRGGSLAPPEDDSIRLSGAARVLELSGVGWGRERYELLDSRVESDIESGLVSTEAKWLIDSVRAWLKPLPIEPAAWSAADVANALAVFLSACRPPASAGDAEVLGFAERLRDSLGRWGIEPCGASASIAFVREALESLSVEASAVPEPGKLHIASADVGGSGGRPLTFLLGMSEEAWSAAVRQDPVLLDAERERLDSGLETSGRRAAKQRAQRLGRLGGIRGRCVAAYCAFRLSDGGERSPAYELLELYRLAASRPEADFDALSAAMGEPVGLYAGSGLELFVDVDEALLRALTTDERTLRDGTGFVLRAYSSLRSGIAALQARSSDALTEYDGVLPPELTSDALLPVHYSASKLELYAKCPLQYFYREALGVRPKDTVEFDRTRWLDPLQRGQLLHDIFYAYMSETASHGGAHDRRRLDAWCERKLREASERIPAPSAHVFEKEGESVRQDVDVFFRMEAKRTSSPAWFELELHRGGEPFALEVAEDFVMPMKGFIDRIDRVAPHRYKIIDYKTGNPKMYEEGAFFAGGTQVQHALYALAAEQWLRTSGNDPDAVVEEAAYAFPTRRGLGEEVIRSQKGRREETASLLRAAAASIRSGAFPPTDRPEWCRYCDYSAVCGSHAERKKHVRGLPEHSERIAPLLEVTVHD